MSKYRKYGWRKTFPVDALVKLAQEHELPESVDLRDQFGPVYDQGQLGSSTANGTAACLQHMQGRKLNWEFMPSSMFLYYKAREEKKDDGQ
jgi:hypothetical protein